MRKLPSPKPSMSRSLNLDHGSVATSKELNSLWRLALRTSESACFSIFPLVCCRDIGISHNTKTPSYLNNENWVLCTLQLRSPVCGVHRLGDRRQPLAQSATLKGPKKLLLKLSLLQGLGFRVLGFRVLGLGFRGLGV